MLIKTEIRIQETEVIGDIYCNVCGRKLKTDNHGYYEDFVHVEKHWGYTSGKDGTKESVDICEQCWDKFTADFAIKVKENSLI